MQLQIRIESKAKTSGCRSDIADMESFISQVQVILPVVGFDFLRQRAKPAPVVRLEEAVAEPTSRLDLVLSSGKYGYEARAIEVDGEITVLEGSGPTGKSDFVENGYSALREQLIKDGRLVPTSDPDFLEFAEDVTFSSPSSAAAVIRNRNTNGRTSWRIAGGGQTLKEWQDAQLAATPTES